MKHKLITTCEGITLTLEAVENLGFKAPPNYTVSPSRYYDLGRNRTLNVASPGTPNEMIAICEHNDNEFCDIISVIVIKNYDYDGYTTISDLSALLHLIKPKIQIK